MPIQIRQLTIEINKKRKIKQTKIQIIFDCYVKNNCTKLPQLSQHTIKFRY